MDLLGYNTWCRKSPAIGIIVSGLGGFHGAPFYKLHTEDRSFYLVEQELNLSGQ